MPGLHEELAVLNDEKRTADPPGICVDPDLSVPDVTDHRHLCVDDVHLSSELPEINQSISDSINK